MIPPNTYSFTPVTVGSKKISSVKFEQARRNRTIAKTDSILRFKVIATEAVIHTFANASSVNQYVASKFGSPRYAATHANKASTIKAAAAFFILTSAIWPDDYPPTSDS